MSGLINIPNTMSTVEIAGLTGKRHDNVMRVANKLSEKGIILAPQIEEPYISGKGRKAERSIYQLSKTESLNLVANLSPEFTAAIITRWQELESVQAIPQSLPEALRLAAEAIEQKQALVSQVEEMLPDVKAFERIAKADGSMCVRDAAKNLGKRPIDLTNWLKENRWLYRRVGTANYLGYQDKVQSGCIEHKVTVIHAGTEMEKTATQARITSKGLTVISRALG